MPKANRYKQPWTAKEDAILTKHMHGDREKLARRLGRTLKAVNSRVLVLGIGDQKRSSSSEEPVFPGPSGWDETKGPPCLSCGLHNCKMVAHEHRLRWECLKCDARVRWDMANRGCPSHPHDMSSDRTIFWTEEVVHSFIYA